MSSSMLVVKPMKRVHWVHHSPSQPSLANRFSQLSCAEQLLLERLNHTGRKAWRILELWQGLLQLESGLLVEFIGLPRSVILL